MKIANFFFAFFMFFGCAQADDSAKNADSNMQNMNSKTVSIQLEGAELYKSIVDQVFARVDTEAKKRESDRWSSIFIIVPILVAVVGFFGVRSIADIKKNIAKDVLDQIRVGEDTKFIIEEAVKKNITSDIEERLGSVSDELSFIRLSHIAESISDGSRTGFTMAERDSIVSALGQLQNNRTITIRPDFALTLEKIIDSFAGADLDSQIDQIMKSLKSVALASTGICMTLIQHYGMRLLGDVSLSEATRNNFADVASACKSHNFYELVLPYIVVSEYAEKREGWSERVDGYFRDIETLNEEDKKRFFDLLDKNTNPYSVAKKPTGQVLRLCEKFNSFVVANKERLEKIRSA